VYVFLSTGTISKVHVATMGTQLDTCADRFVLSIEDPWPLNGPDWAPEGPGVLG
jgi:hypothetical protein